MMPMALVEHLEKAAVEHDACGIALAPFDCKLFAIGKGHHTLASGHKTFRVIAAIFSTVMPGHIAYQDRDFFFFLCFLGSGHSMNSCDNISTRDARRRLRNARCGATGKCGDVSRSTRSQSRSSGAMTQLRGA
jgi:hypothetical protein